MYTHTCVVGTPNAISITNQIFYGPSQMATDKMLCVGFKASFSGHEKFTSSSPYFSHC